MSQRDTLLAQIKLVDDIIAIAPEPCDCAGLVTVTSLRRHRRELMQELQTLPDNDAPPLSPDKSGEGA
jgi:hypothetical protein